MRKSVRVASLTSSLNEANSPNIAAKRAVRITADILANLCLYGCVSAHTIVRVVQIMADSCKAMMSLFVTTCKSRPISITCTAGRNPIASMYPDTAL